LAILIAIGKEYELWSSLCNFLQPPVTSSRPNILLSILISNTLSLRFALNVRDLFPAHTKLHARIIAIKIMTI
jgi:hypothetical protein